MSDYGQKRIVEALIFASDFPIPVKKLGEILNEISESEIAGIIEELKEEYSNSQRGFFLNAAAGGFEFVTHPDHAVWVNKLLDKKRNSRLSHASLETVAITAYRQPLTRLDIENIRGVDSGGPLRTLLDRNLILIAGREKSPGRPLIYKTSEDFLRYFGINSLDDLPQMEEIKDILSHEEDKMPGTPEQLFISGGDSSPAEVRPAD